jgi:hypothetical protein
MSERVVAVHDPELGARVVSEQPLLYEEDSEPRSEHPTFMRAGSSLARLGGRIAVIGDDANYAALIDPGSRRAQRVSLPAGDAGERLFDEEHGNKGEKLDLEACVTVPGDDGDLLVAFGSGSGPGREQVVTLGLEADGSPRVAVYDAPDLYAALRAERLFSGSGVNIEGAVYLENGRMRLFQRGNADRSDGFDPVDATCDLPWPELWAHIQDPHAAPLPSLSSIVQYDLGELLGVRLTFSDAEPVAGGAIMFAASAEGPSDDGQDGAVVGSVLGTIDAAGDARWGELTDQEGGRFEGKVEGLSVSADDPRRVYFVVDMDDPDQPSKLYEAELSGPWYDLP